MRKYFVVQLKRILHILPLVLLIFAILCGCLYGVYTQTAELLSEEELQLRLKVAMVGSLDNSYLQLGLAALQTFDASRMALEVVTMEEDQAKRAMERGDIAAMIVIPEGFIEKALHGEILPLKYVTTSGAIGMVAILKDEITAVINEILIHAQKGIYGAGNAAQLGGANANQVIGKISLEYVDFILARSKMYSAQEVKLEGSLGMRGHIISGLCTLLLLLVCLPFAPVRIRKDLSLCRMMASKGKGIAGQMLCEYGVYFMGLLFIAFLAMGALGMAGVVDVSLIGFVHLLPVIATVAGLSYFLYEMTEDMISGVLLQFFAILVLGLITGCMYPIYFFPEAVQNIAHYLPTGMAREQIGGWITGQFSLGNAGGLLAYGGVFFMGAVFSRRYRMAADRG